MPLQAWHILMGMGMDMNLWQLGCAVPVLHLTGIKVVDSHAILLASPDAEQLPMKVDGVDILSAAHVQEVPSDLLLLSHHQSRQRVTHVAVDGWGRQRS